jgi:hypothetical protein
VTTAARWLASALLLALTGSGCVAPAFDHGAYLENAKASLGSAVSEARTAELAVGARLDDRVTRAYADTVITESEEAIGPIEASFGTVDPPDRADDQLRDDILGILGDTEDALAEARIAVRRDDRPALRESQIALAELGDRLDQAKEDLG